MKMKLLVILSVVLMVLPGTTYAIDIADMDRVSVLMTRQEVHSTIGTPDRVTRMDNLKVELYRVTDAYPLLSAGYIYDDALRLAAHAFVFDGYLSAEVAGLMKSLGFTLLDEAVGASHLQGEDDDTGRPVVVTIEEHHEVTTVITFEREYFENNTIR